MSSELASLSDTQTLADGSASFAVSGPLDFDTVPDLLRDTAKQVDFSVPIVFDLSAATEVNSAALALLIEWRALALKAGGSVKIVGLPDQLAGLIEISGLDRQQLTMDESLS